LLINHYAGSPLHGMEYQPYCMGEELFRENLPFVSIITPAKMKRNY